MFSTNANKGFSITFANGNTVSVQWGPGNYCDPVHPSGRMAPHDAPLSTADGTWQSSTAEVAAWDSEGNWHRCGYDQVKGYLSADEVSEFINFVATSKLDTSSPWSHFDDDEDDEEIEASI